MSVPHYDGLFVDRVDDCLDEEFDGRTEDFISWHGGQSSEGELCPDQSVASNFGKSSIPRNQG